MNKLTIIIEKILERNGNKLVWQKWKLIERG